jgi:general secretion pathway protein L
MTKNVIGLEISESGWRAAVVTRASKEKIKIDNYFSFPDPPFDFNALFTEDFGGEPEEFEEKYIDWSEKVTDALSPYMKNSSGIVVGIPQEYFTLRVLDLPFSQPAKISSVLPYEAESTLPFDADELIFDFYPVDQKDDHTTILAAAVKKEELSGLLSNLKLIGLDPVIVAPTSMALHHLNGFFHKTNGGPPERTAFIKAEEKKARFIVIDNGRGIFSASFNIDENTETYSITLLEKITLAIHHLEGFIPGETGCPPSLKNIVLIGNKGPLTELEERLGESLDADITTFNIPASSITDDTDISIDPEMAGPLALALQKAAANGSPSMNFRRQEFSYRPEHQELIKRAIFPAFLIIMLFISAFMWSSVGGSSEEQEALMIRDQMKMDFQKNFPGSPLIDPAAQIKQKVIDAKAKHIKYQALVLPSALDVLAAVSSSIDKNIDVKISSFTYKEKVDIQGETEELDAPNQITKSLTKVPFFKEVELDKVSQTGSKVKFTIHIDLKGETKP